MKKILIISMIGCFLSCGSVCAVQTRNAYTASRRLFEQLYPHILGGDARLLTALQAYGQGSQLDNATYAWLFNNGWVDAQHRVVPVLKTVAGAMIEQTWDGSFTISAGY